MPNEEDAVESALEEQAEVTLSLVAGGEAGARRMARHLCWLGWTEAQMSERVGVPVRMIRKWRKLEGWDDERPIGKVEAALETRLSMLILKEQKTGGDYKEIDLLGRQIERLARVRNYEQTGKPSELNDKMLRPGQAAKIKAARPPRNFLTEEQVQQLEAAFEAGLFAYQRTWRKHQGQRTRLILKSRQIGATWYFAREAIVSAAREGRNKIFLSASKRQAHIFKQYILSFVREVTGVELSGDPIVLWNGAEIHFLGTNVLTAQGYHGDFYFDEFFWTHRFSELNKVASAMALHKMWRKTYFSTPSSITHEAHALWSGARRNRGRAKEEQIVLDLSHDHLAGGFTGEDKVWRHIVNVMDAVAGGCDLFDLEELRDEYSADEFANLLMCGFIDDTDSIFPLSVIQRCMVDSWELWTDVKPFAARPYGSKPVALGYDPSNTGDSAGLVLLALPGAPGGKFRMLEQTQFRGMDFEAQAAEIKRQCDRYNVVDVAIDTTGMGQGVFQLVRSFFPGARSIDYSLETKTRLVMKAKSVINRGRLEFDSAWVEVAHSFMAIRKMLTASGRGVTYDAGRTEATGHADLAWATMHALDFETLEAGAGTDTSNVVEIS